MPEFPIATDGGVKVPDVVWMPSGRFEELIESGNPPTRAPDVCIEVLSDSNDEIEMSEKRRLYRQAGAEEVWQVGKDGAVEFYNEQGRAAKSNCVPNFPEEV
jgi:Uma2 family endonuclease